MSTTVPTRTGGEDSSWKQFCRDQGRQLAEQFVEQLRCYKLTHNVPANSDAAYAREFTASLTEYLTPLTSTVAEVHGENASASTVVTTERVPSVSPPAKDKHWWQFFKRVKSSRKRKQSDTPVDHNIKLDQIVSQLNFNDGWNRGKLSWSRCRLVLANSRGNYQLEIYSPPKSNTAKTCLFCFLIEEVRCTSALEVPDSNSTFVVKSQRHGEYVFDAVTEAEKQQWMSEIANHSAARNGAIHSSMSLMAIPGNRSPYSTTPVHTSNRSTSPPTENHRAGPPSQSQLEEPALIDMATVNPNLPYLRDANRPASNGVRQASSRRRMVHSMFLDSTNSTTPDLPEHDESLAHSSSSPLQRRASCPRRPFQNRSAATRSQEELPPLPPLPVPAVAVSSTEESSLNNPQTEGSSRVLEQHVVSPTSITSPPAHNTMTNVTENNISTMVHPLSQNNSERFSSSEPLRTALLTFSSDSRTRVQPGHLRQRSLDSAMAHSTDGTSASYRIDTGSIDQVGTRSNSTFSSAGNLHEIIHNTVTSPTTSSSPESPTASEASSIPIYIETHGNPVQEQNVPTHTRHPYQSWANTPTDLDNLRVLSNHPWFHGMISRANAALLVMGNGEESSGQYLVRQSESREGDFVLTFNCHGRSKHLRLTLDASGCNIQHLWFEDISTMLEYFKTHPISLETVPMGDEISLTTHIDRSASDSIRTTTVVNMERIQRTPPRRSRSIHVTMNHAADRGSPTNSSHGSSWRQLFSRQRSSASTGSRSHAVLQRRHSENAGSIREVRSRRLAQERSENRYVWKNY